MLSKPIFAKQGQLLTGRVLMVANAKQSYDLTIECRKGLSLKMLYFNKMILDKHRITDIKSFRKWRSSMKYIQRKQ